MAPTGRGRGGILCKDSPMNAFKKALKTWCCTEALPKCFWRPSEVPNPCQRRSQEGTFSELYSIFPSRLFKRGKQTCFLSYRTSLEVVKIVFFLWKINDFEGSAIIVFLLFTPSFWPPMRCQKPFKMSPKSTSEGYQIRLLFAKAFKIASKINFGSNMTSRGSPKSTPNRSKQGIARPLEANTQFRSILDLFGRDLGPHWGRFWTLTWCQHQPKLKSFEGALE